MSTKNRFFPHVFVLMLTLFAGVFPAAATSAPPKPEGFDQFGVFMATGVFDPASPHLNPEITGCFFMFCDPQYFQEVVMGWNPVEIAAEEADAKLFFWERFGLDVDELAAAGRIAFQPFTIDPRIEYRAYHIAGFNVPAAGWEIRDGGFLVVVTDPDGIDLGGELAGEHAVAGSSVVIGIYNILKTKPNGQPDGEIVVRYRSPSPSTPVDGPIGFVCEVDVANVGSGLAQGVVAHVPLDDGRLNFNIRNVLTFPGLGH